MLLYLVAIATLIVLLILTILFALQYFGLFDPVEVRTGRTPYHYGDRMIIYRTDYGQYNDSSPIFTEICSILPHTPTFGVYLHKDFLNETIKQNLSPERIRDTEYVFVIGCIVIDDGKSISSSTQKMLESKGYRYARLPDQVDNVVYCVFPFRGILSVVVASRRVYAAINDYIEANRLSAYPKIEIYDNDQIYYILPLSQQNHFTKLIEKCLLETSDRTEDVPLAEQSKMDNPVANDDDIEYESENDQQSGHSDSVESNSSYELVD